MAAERNHSVATYVVQGVKLSFDVLEAVSDSLPAPAKAVFGLLKAAISIAGVCLV